MSPEVQSAVRDQLQKMLGDPTFSRTRRTAELLRYLVVQCLEGKEAEIKEFTLAAEVFEKGADFDPRIDSTVRVGVNQLRAKLREYYEGNGRQDEVRIELPHGRYVPQFSIPGAAGEPGNPEGWTLEGEQERRPEREMGERLEGSRGQKRAGWNWMWLVWVWVGIGVGILAGYLGSRGKSDGMPHVHAPRRVYAAEGVSLFPALAADGNTLLFSAERTDAPVLNLHWGDLKAERWEHVGKAMHDQLEPALSPDGKAYAFRTTHGGGGLYLKRAADPAPRLVAENGLAPKFSPDSRKLLYWLADPFTSHGKVYAMELVGQTEPDQKLRGFADAHDAIWTPDGRNILFCGTRRSGDAAQEHDIWVASPDGDFAVKTGAFDVLRKQNIALHSMTLRSTPFTFLRDGLLIEIWTGGASDLWFLPLQPGTYKTKGTAERIHAGAHASIAGDKIVFSLPESNLDIWSFPLDHSRRKSAGAGKRLTTHAADDIGSRAAPDNSAVLFMSNRGHEVTRKLPLLSAQWSLFVRKPEGSERELTPGISVSRGALIDAKSGSAWYRVMEGPSPSKQAIYRVPLSGGPARLECDDCGALTDLFAGTSCILYETPTERNRLAIYDGKSKRRTEILRHPDSAVRSGRISPDEKWIAFLLEQGMRTRRLHIAPFRGEQPIPVSDWIAGTTEEWVADDPTWSPDGKAIYFLTHSTDGKPAVYSVGFDGQGGRVIGEPVETLRFPRLGFSILRPTGTKSFWSGLSVTEDSLVLAVRTLESSLWTGEIR